MNHSIFFIFDSSVSVAESPLRIVAKGAFLVTLSSALAYVLKFFSRTVLARALGPSGFGQFSLGMSVYAFLTLFAGLGIPAAVTRLVAYHRAKQSEAKVYASAALFAVVITSLLATILAYILLPALSLALNVPESVLIPFLAVVLFDLIFSTVRGVVTGYSDVWVRVWLTDIGLALGYVFIVAGAALLFHSPVSAALGFFFTVAALSLLSIAYAMRKSYLDGIPSSSAVLHVVWYSLPFLLISVSSLIFLWTDTVLIGHFLGSAHAGYYQAAVTLVRLIVFFSSAAEALYLPVVTELYTTKRLDDLRRVYAETVRWLNLFVMPLALVLIVFPVQILTYIFGSSYSTAALALRILSIGYLFRVMFGPIGSNLVARGEEVHLSRFLLFGAVLNVLLDAVLIPVLGISGAALASTTVSVLIALILLARVREVFNRRVASVILRIFLSATLAATPVLLALPYLSGYLGLIIAGAAYALLYTALLFLLRVLSLSDLRRAWSVIAEAMRV